MRRSLDLTSSPPNPALLEINWVQFLELARRHQVITLVNAALRDSCWVPLPVRHHIAALSRTIVAHNLSLAAELSLVLEALKRSGITAVPFKGPVWTEILYANVAARHIADLDLFVNKFEIARAASVLCDRGYVLLKVFERAGPADCEGLDLYQPDTGIRLELHWAACELSRDARLAEAALWQPEPKSISDPGKILLPSNERMFLLLAVHGFRHEWYSLKWLSDIAAFVVSVYDVDWNKVLVDAGKLGRTRLVLLPLALAARFNHEPVSP